MWPESEAAASQKGPELSAGGNGCGRNPHRAKEFQPPGSPMTMGKGHPLVALDLTRKPLWKKETRAWALSSGHPPWEEEGETDQEHYKQIFCLACHWLAVTLSVGGIHQMDSQPQVLQE